MKDYSSKLFVVEEKHTAAAMGSGDLAVLATPALVAMVENTAKESIQILVNPGQTTVGIQIQMNHSAAAALGKKVLCKVNLIQQEKRVLVFQFEAMVEDRLIASGIHKRAIVETEKFMSK